MAPNTMVKPISYLKAHTSELIQEVMTILQSVVIRKMVNQPLFFRISVLWKYEGGTGIAEASAPQKTEYCLRSHHSLARTFNNLNERTAGLKKLTLDNMSEMTYIIIA